jgi:hypothetical protein
LAFLALPEVPAEPVKQPRLIHKLAGPVSEKQLYVYDGLLVVAFYSPAAFTFSDTPLALFSI